MNKLYFPSSLRIATSIEHWIYNKSIDKIVDNCNLEFLAEKLKFNYSIEEFTYYGMRNAMLEGKADIAISRIVAEGSILDYVDVTVSYHSYTNRFMTEKLRTFSKFEAFTNPFNNNDVWIFCIAAVLAATFMSKYVQFRKTCLVSVFL